MADNICPKMVGEFLKLRALAADQEEMPMHDRCRLQQAVRAAERDHDWTTHKAMALLHDSDSDNVTVSYHIVSILTIIERRARRARLALMSNEAYTDQFQRDFWRSVVCQDLDDEQAEECPHWDSEVEEELESGRRRTSTQRQLGTNSKRVERWLKSGDIKNRP